MPSSPAGAGGVLELDQVAAVELSDARRPLGSEPDRAEPCELCEINLGFCCHEVGLLRRVLGRADQERNRSLSRSGRADEGGQHRADEKQADAQVWGNLGAARP
jgi:hypothetical protein